MSLGPGICLGLDLSPTLGWVIGRPGDMPRWGAVVLPKPAGFGAVCAAFEDWLDGFIESERPDLIAYEEPLAPMQQGDREGCRYAYGLPFACEGCAFRAGIRCVSHALSTLRGAVIGRYHLSDMEREQHPKPTVKSAIVAPWVRAQGWDIGEPNARDAAVVWAYETGIRHAGFRKRAA